MKIISKKEAIELGLKRYFTGKSCKHGHISDRAVSHGICGQCVRVTGRKYREENPEKRNASQEKYRKNNKEKIKIYSDKIWSDNKDILKSRHAKYRINNIDKEKERHLKYRLENVEKEKEYRKKYYSDNKEEKKKYSKKYNAENPEKRKALSKQWAKNNPEKKTANIAKYRASKLQRTPLWLTEQDNIKIKEIYKKASLLTKYCGQVYHVDHFYPLQGEIVSGLHVPNNLKVITAFENFSKNNRYNI